MPVVDFRTLAEMSAFITGLESGRSVSLYKPTSYARQAGISRQGIIKRCKNSETLYYLRCPSERHVLVVDIDNHEIV